MPQRSTTRKSHSSQSQAREIIRQEGELLLARLRALFHAIEPAEFATIRPLPAPVTFCSYAKELCPLKRGQVGLDDTLKSRVLDEINGIGVRLKSLMDAVNGLDS